MMRKKRIALSVIIYCTTFMVLVTKGQSIQNHDAKKWKSRTKRDIIDHMNRLIKDSLIITGQHCGGDDHNQTKAYHMFFEELYILSGKYPALLGFEYGGRPNVDFEYINNTMINHPAAITWDEMKE